ncbi:N/A [soil metagenome]
MISLLIGSFILIATLVASIAVGSSTHFITLHAAILVGAGSVGILFLATPFPVLKVLFTLFSSMLRRELRITDYREVLQDLSRNPVAGVQVQHALIRYACELWSRGVERDLFLTLLSEKRREIDLKNQDAVHALKNLAKYPPALGMTGTVIGMIGLFAELDKNRNSIGHHLSMALTATFLGLVIANLIVSPLGDRLQIHQANAQQTNTHLYEILLLINNREPSALVEEEIDGRAA